MPGDLACPIFWLLSMQIEAISCQNESWDQRLSHTFVCVPQLSCGRNGIALQVTEELCQMTGDDHIIDITPYNIGQRSRHEQLLALIDSSQAPATPASPGPFAAS